MTVPGTVTSECPNASAALKKKHKMSESVCPLKTSCARFIVLRPGSLLALQTSQYGTIEIVDGERRLKAVALQDPRNTHFILICESASPLFCSSLGESFHATVVHSADLARTESPFLKSRKLLTLMAITQLSMVNSS